MTKWIQDIGPGPLIAAAFIGPGTVTICVMAGASFGYGLLWALVISVGMTLIFQVMAVRAGLGMKQGLAASIRSMNVVPWIRNLLLTITVAAIIIGNAAYEAGNIAGASLGLSLMTPNQFLNPRQSVILIGVFVLLILLMSSHKLLQKLFTFLVIAMSLAFLCAACVVNYDWSLFIQGFIPDITADNLVLILSIIGTTVVPYNIFLHSSMVCKSYNDVQGLRPAIIDARVSIILGGFISMCILLAGTSLMGSDVSAATDLAKALEPSLGSWSTIVCGVGLFAAGITSAIAAPLAASYVASECFGWDAKENNLKFKITMVIIVSIGVLVSLMDWKPIAVIKFAQFANALVLPMVVMVLMSILNNRSMPSHFKNSLFQNAIGLLAVTFAIFLGVKAIILLLEC